MTVDSEPPVPQIDPAQDAPPQTTGTPVEAEHAAGPADEPEAKTPPARSSGARRRRSRLLVLLGVGVTGIGGALWAAVTGSLIENGRNYVSATMDTFRRGEEIRALQNQLGQLQQQYQSLLNSDSLGISAYVGLAYHDKQFCFEALRNWARDGNYTFEPTATPAHFMARVNYYGAPLMIRCAGAQGADWTYIILTATEAQQAALSGAHQELTNRFASYGAYPDAANPPDKSWAASGPWAQVGFVVIEMPFAQYELWVRGVIPGPVADAVTRPSSQVISAVRNGYLFYTVREPGSSLTLRSPAVDAYQVMDATSTWRAHQDVLPPGVKPGATTPVRTEVMTMLTGNYLGTVGGSTEEHFLGADANLKLTRIPGIQDSGNFLIQLQNW